MSVDLRNAFRLSFVTGETELPIPPASEILARLRSGPVWDSASLTPATDDQFPLLHVEWHDDHGFVIQCYEDEQAWSDFLLTGAHCGPPTIEINLGGQTLERWPSELFVSEELAHQALAYFLSRGRQDPTLHWIRIDAFPRETVWEGRDGRAAWERANSTTEHDGLGRMRDAQKKPIAPLPTRANTTSRPVTATCTGRAVSVFVTCLRG